MDKILKNSTPGKVALIWHIERVQIDEIKFEKRNFIFLATSHCPSSISSSLLKLPISMRGTINFYNAHCAVEELWVHFFAIMALVISLILTIVHKTQKNE